MTAPMSLAVQRRQRLAGALRANGVDVLIAYGNAWQGDYLRYATDFGLLEGHGLALVAADGEVLLFLESAVEAERAQIEAAGIEVRWTADAPASVLAELRRRGDPVLAGAPHKLLPRKLVSSGVAIADGTGFVDQLLMRKVPQELDAIREAARLADDAYRVFMQAAIAGTPQYGIVADVEAFLRAHGSAENFMLIGSGGPDVRGMTPPSERRLARGDLVTTELTPEVGGYYAQICRTLVVGKASDVQRRAFAVYHEALEAGIAAVRPGARASDVARAENDVFRSYDLGVYTTNEYTRVRGHGIGLFPDGKPHILEDVDVELVAGMTLVVHPNTYHPDAGYIVLGDSVIVTEHGADVLTRTPRELFEVG
jgi:Xaa-Pro dipeptidase